MVALLLLLSVINDTEFSSGTNILGMPQDDKKRRDSKVRIKVIFFFTDYPPYMEWKPIMISLTELF